MADRNVTGEPRQVLFLQGLSHQAHRGMHYNAFAVTCGDSGALLSPVLERVKSEEGGAGDVLIRRVDADDPASLLPHFPRN